MDKVFKIGFTGTRKGITPEQRKSFRRILDEIYIDHREIEFHHGRCIGADYQSAIIVRNYYPEIHIVDHPCTLEDLQADFEGDEARETFKPLTRNKNIVDECDVLIGTPAEMEEQNRGGTWYTIKYGKKKKDKIVYIIYPTGDINIFPESLDKK